MCSSGMSLQGSRQSQRRWTPHTAASALLRSLSGSRVDAVGSRTPLCTSVCAPGPTSLLSSRSPLASPPAWDSRHWLLPVHISWYLAGTASLGLHYFKPTMKSSATLLSGWSDSDLRGDHDAHNTVSVSCLSLGVGGGLHKRREPALRKQSLPTQKRAKRKWPFPGLNRRPAEGDLLVKQASVCRSPN